MNLNNRRTEIIESLTSKNIIKNEIIKHTSFAFDRLKFLASDLISALRSDGALDKEIELEYRENGKYEMVIKVAGDTIIFSMHTNVFNFDDTHSIHKSPYTIQDKDRVYCGMIEVYNFLSDSIKYDRIQDIGYLIGRIFINKENHFFVEGSRQLGFLFNDIQNMELNDVYLNSIIENSIINSIDFDLWVPAFAQVQQLSVGQLIQKNGITSQKTAKRLGYDISNLTQRA